MAEEQQSSQSGWHAAAYQVRGPGARRGGPSQFGDAHGESFNAPGRRAGAAAMPGDEGELWIAGDALCFAGRHETWSVPLNWLADPETDLAGLTEIRLHTADHGRAITLALAGGVEPERDLAAAIKAARTAAPAERDRRALADLTALLAPALAELGRLVPEGEPGAAPLDPAYASRALALAARLRGAWLPYWGTPASRLRDATLGALLASGTAALAAGDAALLDRAEQAAQRWHNACDDLQQWCGLPEGTLPAARWPRREQLVAAPAAAAHVAPPVAPPAAEPAFEPAPPSVAETPQPAPPAGQPQAAPPTPPTPPAPPVHAEQPVPVPVPPAAPPAMQEEQGTIIIPAPNLPHPPEPEAEGGNTLVIATPGQRPAQPVSPLPQPVAPPVAPPAGPYDDRTIIATQGRAAEDATPPLPPAAAPPSATPPGAESAPAAPAAVVTGPGRCGSGGMTMLYRHSGPDGPIARKELQPDDAARPDVVETFLNIGRRFQAVQQPGFVRILGAGHDGPTPYIDMEFVEGESMSARFGRMAVPAPQALEIAGQIAAAVDAVHQAGVVHGDLRPQNVLIEPGGRVVLLEPSVACDFALEHARGTVYGDLAYLTPERARGDAQSAPSDIYALATLTYALLAGRPPFLFENDPGQIFTAHAEEPPPPLDSLLPGAPPAASAVLARALAKRPNERPVGGAAFVADLRRAFGMGGAVQPPATIQVGAAPPPGPAPSPAPPPQAGPVPAPVPPPSPPAAPPAPRPGASPLGNRGVSPLGNRGASPLGQQHTPPPVPPPAPPRNDDPPD